MASDEYSVVSGGGALKLKGAKVQKKKKKKDKSSLEKVIATGEKGVVKKSNLPAEEGKADDKDSDDERPAVQKTESERRHEETKRKRVSPPSQYPALTSSLHLPSSCKWPNHRDRGQNS